MIPPENLWKSIFIKIDQLSEDVSIIFTNNVLDFFSFRNNLEGVYEIISFCGGGGAYIIRWTIQLFYICSFSMKLKSRRGAFFPSPRQR